MPISRESSHNRAIRVHAQSAQRHLAAAARWAERGDPEWAGFERACATLETELARVEADRADLERLRDRWLQARDPHGRSEIEHRSAEISRRVEELKARDDALELERTRLRERGQRAPRRV